MKQLYRVMCITVLLATTGCRFTPEDRRWSSQTGVDRNTIPVPRLLVSASSAAPTPKVTVKDLQDRTGAAYIQAQAKYARSADALSQALQKPVTTPAASTDLRSFERVVTMTVSKQGFAPADRIVQSRITLTPVNFVFDGLVAAETSYTNVKIDSIADTTSLTGTGSFSPTFGGSVAGAGSLSATGSKSVVDTADIIHQIEQLTVNTDRGSLVVAREGERGFDLAGNTLVKVSLRQLGAPYVSNPNEKQQAVVSEMDLGHPGAWNTGKKLILKFSLVKGLEPIDFVVHARLDYMLRHVYRGADTYREDDDQVQFVPGCVKQDIVVLPAYQTGLQSWGIEGEDHGRLEVDTDEGIQDLAFLDSDTAEKFATWLKSTGATRAAGRRLWFALPGDIDNPVPIGRYNGSLNPVSLAHAAPVAPSFKDGDPQWCNAPPILPSAYPKLE